MAEHAHQRVYTETPSDECYAPERARGGRRVDERSTDTDGERGVKKVSRGEVKIHCWRVRGRLDC